MLEKVIGAIVVVVFAAFVAVFVFNCLWNSGVAPYFHLGTQTMWQSFCLSALLGGVGAGAHVKRD